jgi:parallel beta-helix repeat protein
MKKTILSLIVALIAINNINAATFTVTSVSDSGPGTLRQAILDANALAGPDNISFSIGTGTKTITLLSVVNITSEIDIDGSTQPGFSGTPLIKISGTSMFQITNANGAKVQYLEFINNSGSTAILANSISNCLINSNIIIGSAFGIRLDGDNTNNTITNNNLSGASAHAILFSMGVNNGNNITNNNLTNCMFRGLFYGLGTPASINNNDFTGSLNALFLGGTTNFTLTSPTSSGPNKNIFGNHTGRVLEVFDNINLNISNWDFTSLVSAPLNIRNPLFVRNSIANVFENCNLAGMENGIQFDDDNTNNIINNCNFSGSALYGIVFNNGNNQGNTITNNNLTNCGDYGLYYSNGTPTSVNSNTFTGSFGGIFLSGTNTFTLGSSNIFKNQTGTSIQLEASSAVNVSNNVVNGTGGTGILLNQSNNCVINGNTTCGRTYGIRIQGTSNGNMISNGSIVSSAFGIRLDNSSVNNTTITAVNLFNTTNISNGGVNTVITGTTSTNTSPIITVNSGSICRGQSFTMIPSGAFTYTFSSGSSVVSPTTTTSYSVIGTDANGCVSALPAISNVPVNAIPILSVDNGVICSGQSFSITPSVSFGVATYTYSSGSAVVSPTSTATYSVFATSGAGCVIATPAISNVTVNPLPNIILNIGEICAGQSFTIVPTGADTYTYTSGSSIVTPSTTTSYSVSGTNALTGCTNTAISTVTVNALPAISVNSGSICYGQSFTMIPSGADTYTYSSGSSVVTPTVNTSYNVVGTSSLGCVSSNTAISTVTVNSLPIISVNSGTVCAGQSFTMVPSGAVTYSFSNGSSVATPTANASYSVSGTDANGCVSIIDAVSSVIVNALPSISVNSGSICAGQSFTMIPSGADTYTYSNGSSVATPTSNATYSVSGTNTVTGCVSNVDAVSSVIVNALPSISVNSGTICAGQSFTMVPSGADTYTYSSGSAVVTPTLNSSYDVTGTDANGCVGSNTAVSSVIVNALPTISVNSGSICTGQSFTITPSGASTYTYSSGSAVVTPTLNSSYDVTGTAANGCIGSNTAISSITVNALPNITAMTTHTLLCVGETATLTVMGASTYTWSTAENTADIAVTPSIQTTYTVIGTDVNECVNSVTILQDVSLCTGLYQIASVDNDLSVYPNPSNGNFNINVTSLSQVTILNLLGKVIYAEQLDVGVNSINLNQFANGIYLLKSESNGYMKTIRLIKQ